MPRSSLVERHPWLAYVLPFGVFMAMLGLSPVLGLPRIWEPALRLALPALTIVLVARPVLDFRVTRPLGTVLIGVGVFLLWIGPDLLFPAYRSHTLFQNSLTGRVVGSPPPGIEIRGFIPLRVARAVLVVPIVEELFWRGWLPRWLDHMHDFRARALGEFSRWSFWASAGLFALEHGAFWDVGFGAGLIYNWWMRRTGRLGDLIACHAVTNACLGAYVLASGKWGYW